MAHAVILAAKICTKNIYSPILPVHCWDQALPRWRLEKESEKKMHFCELCATRTTHIGSKIENLSEYEKFSTAKTLQYFDSNKTRLITLCNSTITFWNIIYGKLNGFLLFLCFMLTCQLAQGMIGNDHCSFSLLHTFLVMSFSIAAQK